jgi:aminopeptidase N
MHAYELILHSLTFFQRDKQGRRRLICAVATEPLPKQVEESKMDTPKEIFLKDHKLPDYYFDSVWKKLSQV